jgi:hypothetical protein
MTQSIPKGSLQNPEHTDLYGGLSGVPLAIQEFKVCEGLTIRKTYAHLMAPYVLAFAPPERPGSHHPGPWKPAHGGLGFDITAEIVLAEACRPTSFDRVNTLWWTLALLRLATGAPLRMPVISDTSFSDAAHSPAEPTFWTAEMLPHQLLLASDPPAIISHEHLKWVQSSFLPGARLMDIDHFNRAVQTFDTVIWAHSLGSAIVLLWAALETLFRPGRANVTKTLATCAAAFLCPPGGDRDRMYQKVERLYEARGSAAHNSQVPATEQRRDSFLIARQCISKCIEEAKLPDAKELVSRWKERR